jgi:hypothetical protein
MRTRAAGMDLYLENLGNLALGLARTVAGAVDVRRDAADYLGDPTVWLYGSLLAVGLVWGAMRGSAFPLLVTIPYCLLLPLVNAKFEVIPNGRFLAPLLPLAYPTMALGLGTVWTCLRRYSPRLGHRWVIHAAAVLLVGWPLYPLAVRYEQMAESEAASVELMSAVRDLRSRSLPGEWVALDPDLDKLWLDGGGDYRAALRYLLEMHAIPHDELEFREKSERGDIRTCEPTRVQLRWVMPERSPDAARLFADDPNTPEDESRRAFWQIRTVQRRDRVRDAALGQDREWSSTFATYAPPVFGSARAVGRCTLGRPI